MRFGFKKYDFPRSSALKGHLQGFTLIELLVVIAIIGVLAAIVLLAVNPGEQLARARDTSRISAITQIGKSLQSYYIVNNATYPATGDQSLLVLVTSGDLKTFPTNPGYGGGLYACNPTHATNGYCYNSDAAETIVFARLESAFYNNKCTSPPNTQASWVFSTGNSRAGGVCNSTDPGVTAVINFSF